MRHSRMETVILLPILHLLRTPEQMYVFAPTSTEAAALIIEQAASQGLETADPCK